jgi:hypothetical protein
MESGNGTVLVDWVKHEMKYIGPLKTYIKILVMLFFTYFLLELPNMLNTKNGTYSQSGIKW